MDTNIKQYNMETTSIRIKDLELIKQALEILIEDIENDMIDDSWNSQYRQELLVKLNELYERL